MIFDEHLGDKCPVCNDVMTEHSNYQPVWSDDYDNIICTTCAIETRCGLCNVVGSGVENQMCDECFTNMPIGTWVSA